MDRTPIHDPSMTPSPHTTSAGSTTSGNQANQTAIKSMIYVCGECHKDNELKATDVIRCKIKLKFIYFYFV